MLTMQAREADTCLAVLLADDFARDTPRRNLTRAERAEVESLIVDGGYTRDEALVWVREMGVGVGQ